MEKPTLLQSLAKLQAEAVALGFNIQAVVPVVVQELPKELGLFLPVYFQMLGIDVYDGEKSYIKSKKGLVVE